MAEMFWKVECPECGNKQNVYSRPADDVACLVCSTRLVESTGGKGELDGELVETLEVR